MQSSAACWSALSRRCSSRGVGSFFDLHLLNAADLRLDELLLPQLADRPERAFGRLGQLRRRERPRRGGQNPQRIELLLAELQRARLELLRTAGGTLRNVISRVPALPRTPAGTIACSTWPSGHR